MVFALQNPAGPDAPTPAKGLKHNAGLATPSTWPLHS